VRRALRPALVLAATLAVGVASAASAAPAGPSLLSFKDAVGDNVSPSSASDIAAVTFTTSGKGKGARYVPKSLVLTLTLAAPPTSDGTTMYGIDADLAGCGNFYVQYMPGARLLDSFNYADCGGGSADPTSNGTSFVSAPEVKGTSIVWTIPFTVLPAPVKAGTVFSKLNAQTDFVDPATSIVGPYSLTGQALYDTASTDAAYTVR
jgi:hypothetical protein